MVLQSFVNYETTLHDRTHKGNRQAGNKSLLAFRSDIGIPGYTGFIPITTCVRVEAKPMEHTGSVATTEQQNRALENSLASPHASTLYKDTYKVKDSDVKPRDKHGGGYWIRDFRRIDPTYKLAGDSTYQAEINKSAATATGMLSRTNGLSMTVSQYEAARQRATAALDGPPACDPLTRTWNRDLAKPDAVKAIAYTTTYGSMVIHNPLVGGSAAAGRPATVSLPIEERPKIAPRGLAPRLDGTSSYHISYGRSGEDPVGPDRWAHPTTVELDIGTSRCSQHIPGYSGFVPVGTGHGVGATGAARTSGKDAMLPLDLGQYSRQILPGYGGAKPREAINVRLDQKPTTQTMYGHENAATQALTGTLTRRKEEQFPLSVGVLGFFSGGGEFISDNGKSEAEKYFGIMQRPLGGLPSVHYPSKTTSYGSKFTK